ncbi:hypothetical protein CDAR_212041 [Caerostris darwini]|uniref:Ribosomal protein S11 n=1 Tax=Caerostris darwini TaxID=1538125 RepID=A0AAV4NVC5_9ARAC|nr:hypothetical protein CDAR_212041 [Caerostris darwini]
MLSQSPFLKSITITYTCNEGEALLHANRIIGSSPKSNHKTRKRIGSQKGNKRSDIKVFSTNRYPKFSNQFMKIAAFFQEKHSNQGNPINLFKTTKDKRRDIKLFSTNPCSKLSNKFLNNSAFFHGKVFKARKLHFPLQKCRKIKVRPAETAQNRKKNVFSFSKRGDWIGAEGRKQHKTNRHDRVPAQCK